MWEPIFISLCSGSVISATAEWGPGHSRDVEVGSQPGPGNGTLRLSHGCRMGIGQTRNEGPWRPSENPMRGGMAGQR